MAYVLAQRVDAHIGKRVNDWSYRSHPIFASCFVAPAKRLTTSLYIESALNPSFIDSVAIGHKLVNL